MKKIVNWGLAGVFAVSSLSPVLAVERAARHAKASAAIQQQEFKVNLNQADVAQLTDLKGIGPKKAQTIVAYREQHGPFKTVDELAQVKGIGKHSLDRILANNPGRLIATP